MTKHYGPRAARKADFQPGVIVKVYAAGRSGKFIMGMVMHKADVPLDPYGIPRVPGFSRKMVNDDIPVRISDSGGIVITHRFRLEKA